MTKEEVITLHIQTVEPWKRGLIAFTGLLAGLFAFGCYRGGAPFWFWGSAAACAIVVIAIGLFGQKQYLEQELWKMKQDGSRRILDAIINGLC